MDMNNGAQLTLEQQFSLRSFETQVQQMSHSQSQEMLVKLYESMLVRDHMYQQFLKKQWGLESPKFNGEDD